MKNTTRFNLEKAIRTLRSLSSRADQLRRPLHQLVILLNDGKFLSLGQLSLRDMQTVLKQMAPGQQVNHLKCVPHTTRQLNGEFEDMDECPKNIVRELLSGRVTNGQYVSVERVTADLLAGLRDMCARKGIGNTQLRNMIYKALEAFIVFYLLSELLNFPESSAGAKMCELFQYGIPVCRCSTTNNWVIVT